MRTRSMRSVALVVGLLAGSLCVAHGPYAHACECVAALPTSAADLLSNHAAIFEGRVLGATEPSDPPADAGYEERLTAAQARLDQLLSHREVHFEVLRSWKGPTGHAVVRTRAQRSACGYSFAAGRTYLVFAYAGDDGALWVSACGRTRPSEEAHDDRVLLNSLGASARPAAVVPPRSSCAGCAIEPDGGAYGSSTLALTLVAALRRLAHAAARQRRSTR
jgi:hypothetical protein